MKNHVMIDVESLSTQPDAVLLTFGAIRFRPSDNDVEKDAFEMEHFYRRIDPESCTKLGLRVDEPTMEWWAKQDDDVKAEAFSLEDRCDIADVMKDFYMFCKGCDHFWAHGSIFDIMIIETINRILQRGNPWKFWQIRDTRTLYGLVDMKLPKTAKHHSLYDCYNQILGVQASFAQLGIK
tara:strand:+ start:306 stop:845 length:540 start_codon:yes stop_codon:yes gene_type:complete